MQTDTRVEDITPETLDLADQKREQTRLRNLVHREIMRIGKEFRLAAAEAEKLENRCKMRAMRLYELGMTQLELEHLFGVPKGRMNQWLRTIK